LRLVAHYSVGRGGTTNVLRYVKTVGVVTDWNVAPNVLRDFFTAMHSFAEDRVEKARIGLG